MRLWKQKRLLHALRFSTFLMLLTHECKYFLNKKLIAYKSDDFTENNN